jgi:hypothetical protein
LRNVYYWFNTIWHSSITIQSNCRVVRNWFKNVANSSLTADLGVTNTTAAASGGRRPSYAVYAIPNTLHRRIMSPRNAINGMTTMVVLPYSAHAGNMNNKLFPPLVGITAMIGLSPAIIAAMAACCTLRNSAILLIIRFNCAVVSIFLNRPYQSIRASSASLSNGALFRFLLVVSSFSLLQNPKNRCQSMLDAWNCCLLSAIAPACSIIPLIYIIPAMCAVYPACLSAINAPAFSLFYSSFSSPSSVLNAVAPRKNCWLILIAISRYAAIVNSCPNPNRLSRFNASRNRSDVYLRPLGLAGYICDETASFSYNVASNRCWNGNTNYKYYTTNSPTSRGKYRCMILMSLLMLYPL